MKNNNTISQAALKIMRHIAKFFIIQTQKAATSTYETFGDWIDNKKLITRALLVWLAVLITSIFFFIKDITYILLERVDTVTGNDFVTVINAIIGSVGVLVGIFTPLFLLYKFLRQKDYDAKYLKGQTKQESEEIE